MAMAGNGSRRRSELSQLNKVVQASRNQTMEVKVSPVSVGPRLATQGGPGKVAIVGTASFVRAEASAASLLMGRLNQLHYHGVLNEGIGIVQVLGDHRQRLRGGCESDRSEGG
ncbi:MAG: hypothetical protein U0231_01930 [Nitrospiraceae bacterium]